MSFLFAAALLVQSPAAPLELPRVADERDAVIGEARFVPVSLDDSIPLPTRAVYAPGDAGDTLLTPASGESTIRRRMSASIRASVTSSRTCLRMAAVRRARTRS
jgi:hypothetical protein